MGCLLSFDSIPLAGLLNNSASAFCNPVPMGVKYICKRAWYIFTSLLV